MTVLNTIYSMEDGTAHLDAAFAELIPLLVIMPQESFLAWRDGVLKRLAEHYPRSAGKLGRPVPREMMDTLHSISSTEEPILVSNFLSKALADQNPFIRVISK